MKFYPSDWRSDPKLRLCSLAARGLWMEMLCIMHEAEPRGYLISNGSILSRRQIASLCGCQVKETDALIAELDEAGVLSMTPEGLIYSRRIIRDEEKAAKDKANGKLGGNPNITPHGVNPPDNHPLKPSDKAEDKAQIPEARKIPSQEEGYGELGGVGEPWESAEPFTPPVATKLHLGRTA